MRPNRPPSLAELQSWLRWIVTDPRGVRPALAGAPPPGPALARADRPEPGPRWLRLVRGDERLAREERLQIYAGAYFSRLHQALAADYPAVRRALGARSFQRLAAEYLVAHPSASPSLADLGARLPSFLRSRRWVRARARVAELALLERAVLRAQLTSRIPARVHPGPGTPRSGEWAEARLELDPTVHLLAVAWPVDRLWRRRQAAEKAALAGRGRRAGRRLLVHRGRGGVRVEAIGKAQWVALRSLRRGAPLGRVCDALARDLGRRGRGAGRVSGWFAAWTRNGVIQGFRP
jgi:hypothetical protein